MKKIIKISVVLIILFQNFQTKSQDFKEFEQIKQLADLLSPEGDLAKEIKKFKDSTNVNFYFKIHIEEDTALLPYLVELYTEVRVEKIEPYIIFTLNLEPKTNWTDFAHYTLSYNIEVSPDLLPLYNKLSKTIELLNKLVSNIQAILQDIQTLRQNLEAAIKDLQQGLEILKRMPEILKESFEIAKQDLITKTQKSNDSINSLLIQDSAQVNILITKINGFDINLLETAPPTQENIVISETDLKKISEEELTEIKTNQDLKLFLDLSDTMDVLNDLTRRFLFILENANYYDLEKLTKDLSESTMTFINKINELIIKEEDTEVIVSYIKEFIVDEINKIYNLQIN